MLDVGHEKKRGSKDESKVFGVSNLKYAIAINLGEEDSRKRRFWR